MKTSSLIALEGLDGCGKSTQVSLLAQALKERGQNVIQTREPTDGAFGRRIRELSEAGEPVSAEEELRWFVEDRREHVRQVIRPGLRSGAVVITDRYYLSTVAYQGARGLDPKVILRNSEEEFPAPDLAILLKVDPQQGLERVMSRGHRRNLAFESVEFLEKVSAVFDSVERPYLARVDGSLPEKEVHQAILQLLEERLGD